MNGSKDAYKRRYKMRALGEGNEKELHQVEEQIDRQAAELWGLADEELKDIQAALKEIS